MNDNVLEFVDLAPHEESFGDAVLASLSQTPKSIPCKFLYDARGSALFDRICALPEYYPTRTEIAILRDRIGEIAALAGEDCQIVELGSGSSRKTRILLDALDRPACYVPVDISRDHLRRAAAMLAARYPRLNIVAMCADYGDDRFVRDLPDQGARLVFFPGSTIGNLEPDAAERFLARCARLAGPDGAMLIGVDLEKDTDTLNAAYNDAAGVTAAFNLNLLVRMNRELAADFDLDRFTHDAFYIEDAHRIEIHIRSLDDQRVRVAGRRFELAENERIHTENSYKYSIEAFQDLAARAGFEPIRAWTDRDRLFSVHYLRVA